MAQNLQGKAWTFSDNIDTDVIIPARYLTSSNETELGSHCMEDIDAEFSKKVASGDIIVAGENFGCGSSREHAPLAIKGAGCSCVITASFARIFFRNAINVGLPIFECPEAVAAIENGDELIIKPEEGTIENISQGKVFSVVPFSPFLQELIEQGGLIAYVQKQLSVRGE